MSICVVVVVILLFVYTIMLIIIACRDFEKLIMHACNQNCHYGLSPHSEISKRQTIWLIKIYQWLILLQYRWYWKHCCTVDFYAEHELKELHNRKSIANWYKHLCLLFDIHFFYEILLSLFLRKKNFLYIMSISICSKIFEKILNRPRLSSSSRRFLRGTSRVGLRLTSSSWL